MTYKTTVSWKASPDIALAANSSDPGKAGYKVKYVFDNGDKGVVQHPELKLPPGQTSMTIEAEAGQRVIVLVAAISIAGVMSPATPLEFLAGPNVPPIRPTEVHVSDVIPALKIATDETDPDQSDGAASLEVVHLSVEKMDGVPDMSVGRILSMNKDTIEVDFNGVVKLIAIADAPTFGVKIITSGQKVMSIDEYIESIGHINE